LIPGMN